VSRERYAAFFSAINVGGNRLLMAELREALRREEFEDVESVIASGNVLFSHDERPSDGLAEKLGYVLRDKFGIDSFAAVRSREEVRRAIADNPFVASGEANFVQPARSGPLREIDRRSSRARARATGGG
jgi:uncharacterized protein (DUF1697 family)